MAARPRPPGQGAAWLLQECACSSGKGDRAPPLHPHRATEGEKPTGSAPRSTCAGTACVSLCFILTHLQAAPSLSGHGSGMRHEPAAPTRLAALSHRAQSGRASPSPPEAPGRALRPPQDHRSDTSGGSIFVLQENTSEAQSGVGTEPEPGPRSPEKSATLDTSCLHLSRVSTLGGPEPPAQARGWVLGLPGRGDGQRGGEVTQVWEPGGQLRLQPQQAGSVTIRPRTQSEAPRQGRHF